MRTFTISEVAAPGIQLTASLRDLVPRMVIGCGENATVIEVSEQQRQAFVAMHRVHWTKSLPVGLDDEGSAVASVFRAEFNKKTRRVETQAPPARYKEKNLALVYVHTAAGHNGKLWFSANVWDERLHDGRVVREYRPFPAVGVDVLAIGTGPTGEPEALLQMHQGASFRIQRDGDLQGLPPTLVVSWTGSVMKCFEPGSQKSNEQRARHSHAA